VEEMERGEERDKGKEVEGKGVYITWPDL